MCLEPTYFTQRRREMREADEPTPTSASDESEGEACVRTRRVRSTLTWKLTGHSYPPTLLVRSAKRRARFRGSACDEGTMCDD